MSEQKLKCLRLINVSSDLGGTFVTAVILRANPFELIYKHLIFFFCIDHLTLLTELRNNNYIKSTMLQMTRELIAKNEIKKWLVCT